MIRFCLAGEKISSSLVSEHGLGARLSTFSFAIEPSALQCRFCDGMDNFGAATFIKNAENRVTNDFFSLLFYVGTVIFCLLNGETLERQ
jgi:hypothetical protein